MFPSPWAGQIWCGQWLARRGVGVRPGKEQGTPQPPETLPWWESPWKCQVQVPYVPCLLHSGFGRWGDAGPTCPGPSCQAPARPLPTLEAGAYPDAVTLGTPPPHPPARKRLSIKKSLRSGPCRKWLVRAPTKVITKGSWWGRLAVGPPHSGRMCCEVVTTRYNSGPLCHSHSPQ